MHWEINVVTSVTLLAFLQGHQVRGVSQESSYVIECIRDMIPTQIYNDCCMRENNCTISRQQNRAIDCMSRIIMTNYSSLFSDSRENGPGTTDMSHNRNHQFYNDILDTLGEMCRRQPRARLQTCIRNELIKRCRYSMLQDRFTSSPGRWNQRRTDTDNGYDNFRTHGTSQERSVLQWRRRRRRRKQTSLRWIYNDGQANGLHLGFQALLVKKWVQ
ncbi:uncharacterized protein CDAR_462381 [Caerostris darwini]|uniref:Uncharacterized protein n=1 Tax=Caerostris darwini TaxID=1538125 RepID=A0AAV4WQK4_9ARAC|nr:uncharacterized protein CDAR_462381 [Caerostris darwini]